MKRLPFRQGVTLAMALTVLAAVVMALWLGVFRQDQAAASPGIDLVVTKTASPTEATRVDTADTVTYTLTATNSGDAPATDVLIRDWVGTGLAFVSIDGGAGVTCTDDTGPDYDCTADIGIGASVTVTVVVTVSAASGSFVYNGAYVDPAGAIAEDNEDADDPDLDCSAVGEGTDAGDATEDDNYDCTLHEVGNLDLTVAKTAVPLETTEVGTGATMYYVVTVTNESGTDTATNVPIRDTIGSGLSLFSVSEGTGVTCADKDPPEINCTAASIPPGGNVELMVTATVTGTTATVLNGAYVDPENVISETNNDADDPDWVCGAVGEGTDVAPATEADNYDCTSHTVAGVPDLLVTKSASPSETTIVETGDTITYTLTVSNSASATGGASSVPIRDWVGEGLTFVSAAPGTGVTCADDTPPQINCTATSIAAGDSVTVTIVATVSATSGAVLNGAKVDPGNVIAELNEDADDPARDCGAVGEGTDAATATEADNYDCTRHALEEATPTPTPTPTPTATPTPGVLLNCPLVGKWAMSVWDGPTTSTATALATCTTVTIDAAYSLDRVTNQWSRYFPGAAAGVNNLLTLSDMQAIFTFGR